MRTLPYLDVYTSWNLQGAEAADTEAADGTQPCQRTGIGRSGERQPRRGSWLVAYEMG
jgi:hypothetical protein